LVKEGEILYESASLGETALPGLQGDSATAHCDGHL
jgi:hypothetical protein